MKIMITVFLLRNKHIIACIGKKIKTGTFHHCSSGFETETVRGTENGDQIKSTVFAKIATILEGFTVVFLSSRMFNLSTVLHTNHQHTILQS